MLPDEMGRSAPLVKSHPDVGEDTVEAVGRVSAAK
jgi:hypothetical protein